MNVFLVVFVAVIFALIVKDVAHHTLAQLWVALQLRRAGVRRVVAIAIPPTLEHERDLDLDAHMQRQSTAFTDLHVAAIDLADANAREDVSSGSDALLELLNAATRLRGTLSEHDIKSIRDGRDADKRQTETAA